MQEAEKRWKTLCGKARLVEVVALKKFVDGLPVDEKSEEKNVSEKQAA